LTADDEHAERINRNHWDEIAPVHLESYGIEGLLQGRSRIDEIQKREFYPVEGKDLIHLQCHIGTDTLSLALDGANVTGVDFSSRSIDIAKRLADRMKLKADFIVANVLDLQAIVLQKYDIVYTSKGALCWIRDIDKWAETVAFLLKDGGIFYIMDTHPFVTMLEDRVGDALGLKYPYFHQSEPLHFGGDRRDYADSTYTVRTGSYEWIWPLSDIINAIIRQGLTIEFVNEHDKLYYQEFPEMAETEDGWWFLEKYKGMIPWTFSMRARKGK